MFEVGLYLIGAYWIIFVAGLAAGLAPRRRVLRRAFIALAITICPIALLGVVMMLGGTALACPLSEWAYKVFLVLLVTASVLVAKFLSRERGAACAKALLAMVLMLLPVIPYAIVEAQTALFMPPMAHQIRYGIAHSGIMINVSQIRQMKLLFITPCSAGVYILEGDSLNSDFCASYVGLRHDKDGWTPNPGDWSTVWSDSGSAHGVIFPPYPGKGDCSRRSGESKHGRK
jgi:hypothetical protein